ncbi:MAG: VWA domain-containing protein [Planctomycetes bacterium]|nr:VWA domain-containing protein [Planctomycetota bacterium]
MRTTMRSCIVAAGVLAMASAALGDGMIVPVRPDVRVRGGWIVKYHHVDMVVRDQVASVTIDQQFVNTGRGMMEVEYLFPIPPEAAIDSMTLLVDGKEFAAKVLKADEARKIYEEIVRQKKDPALLEYVGFGLVKTSAFPLEPGKPCRVAVTYRGLCKKDQDLVEVWYPLNTEKFSAKAIESVRVKADIKSHGDVLAVYSPTHDLDVKRVGPDHVIATYEAKNVLPLTDFQAFFQESGEAVGATFASYGRRPSEDGYFMMLVSPNPRVAGKATAAKDVVLVVDVSGSMAGEKLSQAKEAVKTVLEDLNAEDRFHVIAYNDAIDPLCEGLVDATRKAVDEAVDRVDRLQARGGTAIYDALQEAMKAFEKKSRRPGYILFLTDGQPTIGNTDEGEILSATRTANPGGVRLFAFGVGYDVNVRLLDKLVDENRGKSDYVKPKESAGKKVSALYAKIKNPVMTDLEVSVKDLPLRQVYPRRLGDLFDGDQIVLFGRYDAKAAGDLPASDDGVRRSQLVVTGRYEGRERGFEYPVEIRTKPDGRYEFVEKLWAMRRVGFLLDEIQLHGKDQSKELIDELIRLSRDYGILTPYTSFLADERVDLADRPRAAAERFAYFGRDAAKRLKEVDGAEGQLGAVNRQILREAEKAGRSVLTPEELGLAEPAGGAPAQAGLTGNAAQDAYEEGRREVVVNARQVGNQGVYKRGSNVWIVANAADIDPEKDAAKIRTIERFSPEYFDLASANTVAENQILASQRAGEELIIRLRSQVYRIR